MMKILLKFKFTVFFILLISSCSSNDDSPEKQEPSEAISLEKTKLTDFPLAEVAYLNITIEHPVVENNEEVEEGEIVIFLPHTVSSRTFSLKSTNLNTNNFDVFPSVGTQQLFSETETVKYTITSKSNLEKSVHYNVKIVIAAAPQEEKLAIVDFELLANDNSSYTNIDFVKEAKQQTVDSLLFCLFPASIDFSDLSPAIKYNGSIIEYQVNDEGYKEYVVSTGERINFKYPNVVDFKISNKDNTKSVVYRIIVDIDRPIVLDKEEITTINIKKGSTYNGTNLATWTNKGNYPITTMSQNEYTNVVTPAAGINNIFALTLSKNSGGDI
ncbi:MAG: hypothetical protein ABJD66_13060, partial [Cellulophaga sp.]|uniref:hypothetical protein n=1 Tax=Cellulophaga sp. TaxID=1972202 RepID=UPI003266F26C